jgi:hypothetical protein
VIYTILFKAAAETLADCARSRLGVQIGFTGILHTGGRLFSGAKFWKRASYDKSQHISEEAFYPLSLFLFYCPISS